MESEDIKVEDNYFEHSQHLVYDSKCSECHKNPPQVKLNKEGFIVLDTSEEEIEEASANITDEEWEQCKHDKLLEEAESAQRDDEQGPDEFYDR